MPDQSHHGRDGLVEARDDGLGPGQAPGQGEVEGAGDQGMRADGEFGFGLVLRLLGRADVFGSSVALGLRVLQFLNRYAALLVAREDLIQEFAGRPEGALLKPGNKGVRVITYPFDVEHWLKLLSDNRLKEPLCPPYKAGSGPCHDPRAFIIAALVPAIQ